jgi:hypothetical protein
VDGNGYTYVYSFEVSGVKISRLGDIVENFEGQRHEHIKIWWELQLETTELKKSQFMNYWKTFTSKMEPTQTATTRETKLIISRSMLLVGHNTPTRMRSHVCMRIVSIKRY